MARQVNRLSVRKVQTLNTLGRHADGGGLYLSIAKDGGRKWVFLYRRTGRLREMGLGSARVVTLAEARGKAARVRSDLARGADPLRDRQKITIAPIFSECLERYLAASEAGWRNAKHAAQWRSTLARYAYPIIGKSPIDTIDTSEVVRILEPIWTTKTETASRVRGRMESVLDWATARGYRSGDNPARWRGHLDKLFPLRSKVRSIEHHSALPFSELRDFMNTVALTDGISARALEFVILTACRTGEALNATADEFDFERRLWTIPASRMKAGREHRVPLSLGAISALARAGFAESTSAETNFVFAYREKSLSSNALLALLSRLKRRDITVHGFRSSFRDWAAETTAYPSEVIEMALAHSIKDKTEAAYRRGDLIAKRQQLMEDWSKFCGASA